MATAHTTPVTYDWALGGYQAQAVAIASFPRRKKEPGTTIPAQCMVSNTGKKHTLLDEMMLLLKDKEAITIIDNILSLRDHRSLHHYHHPTN